MVCIVCIVRLRAIARAQRFPLLRFRAGLAFAEFPVDAVDSGIIAMVFTPVADATEMETVPKPGEWYDVAGCAIAA